MHTRNAHIDKKVDLLLLRHNGVCASAKPAFCLLDHVQLLKRQVRLEKGILRITFSTYLLAS